MDDQQRLAWGLFRFGCISQLLREPLARGERRRRLEQLAAREWEVPAGARRRFSCRSPPRR